MSVPIGANRASFLAGLCFSKGGDNGQTDGGAISKLDLQRPMGPNKALDV
jgi:hypothetical protein